MQSYFYLCTCICSQDHWPFCTNYLDCQIRCHSAGEGTKAGHYPIIEAKGFFRCNKPTEAAKSTRVQYSNSVWFLDSRTLIFVNVLLVIYFELRDIVTVQTEFI